MAEDPIGGDAPDDESVPNEVLAAHLAMVAAWSENFEIVKIVDTQGPLNSKVLFDQDKKRAYVGVGEGVDIERVEWVDLYLAWGKREEEPTVDAGDMFGVRVDPSAQRTCRFFSPSAEYVETFSAELHPDYDYDRPHQRTVCHNPVIAVRNKVPNPECEQMWWQGICDKFRPGDQILIASYDIESRYKIEVFKDRNGQGIPTFVAYRVNPSYRTMIWKLPLTQFEGDEKNLKAKTEWLLSSLNTFIKNVTETEGYDYTVDYKMEDPFTEAQPVEITHRKFLANVTHR